MTGRQAERATRNRRAPTGDRKRRRPTARRIGYAKDCSRQRRRGATYPCHRVRKPCATAGPIIFRQTCRARAPRAVAYHRHGRIGPAVGKANSRNTQWMQSSGSSAGAKGASDSTVADAASGRALAAACAADSALVPPCAQADMLWLAVRITACWAWNCRRWRSRSSSRKTA